MKMRYYFMSLLTAAMAFAMVSCSDDEPEMPKIIPAEVPATPDITVSEASVKAKIGAEPAAINITNGAGEYHAISLNPEIATVEISGDKILVRGVVNGKTEVLITDKAGKTLTVPVQSYTSDELKLDITDIKAEFLIGKKTNYTVKVTVGNGDYTIKSDNENVSVSITAEGVATLSVKAAQGTYTAKVTIGDAMGLTAVVTLNITGTDNPFDEAYIEYIKSLSATIFRFDDGQCYYASYGGTSSTKTETGYLFSQLYYTSYGYKVAFDGDCSLGKKENASVYLKDYVGLDDIWYNTTFTNIELEVIKTDGSAVWLIFKFKDSEGAIHYGYLVDNIPE